MTNISKTTLVLLKFLWDNQHTFCEEKGCFADMVSEIPQEPETYTPPVEAFIANLESKQIWLVAVKLKAENGQLGIAFCILTHFPVYQEEVKERVQVRQNPG
ncbi:hypothetical protein EDD16DRAFT_1520729 [Pisolithus croceorrhizus]|nr:hypothetical protein EDD16DRAFT_1520729 [Pisolithus croceorrhizus]KAI6137524.1 hypothetical protein EDD17DRAFT_1517241 [Pisolithus thermaeus]